MDWITHPPGSSVHGISRQQYWNGSTFPSPGDLPNWEKCAPQIHSCSTAGEFLPLSYEGSPGRRVKSVVSLPQLCPTLCNPMDCSTPGFPVHHQLPEFTQIHVHRVGDAIQPSHSSSVVPFFSCLWSFPASRSFPMSQFFTSGGQSIGASASASVLPMNTQDWSPLGDLQGDPTSPRDSQESSPTPQFKNTNYFVLSLLYSPTCTSTHDH